MTVPGSGVVGRDSLASSVWSALQTGVPVVVCGVAGVGRTTVVQHALEGRRTRFGRALATASYRPYLALEVAFAATAPESPTSVIEWAVEQCGDRVLVIDDLHLAHPATVDAAYRLAGAVPLVVTIETGRPAGDALLAAVSTWVAHRPAIVEVPPLSDDEAAEVVRRAHPGVAGDELADTVAAAGGRPGFLVAGRDLRSGAVLDELPVAERTALVAAALLARPCPARLLGPGADGLVARGLAYADDAGDLVVVGVVAAAALARTTADDRAALHASLATLLPDPEAARHLHAAGRPTEAAARALRAARAAPTPRERADHLHFAARCAGTPAAALDAAKALLALGDVASVLSLAPALADAGADGSLVVARAARLAGAAPLAAEAVRRGLGAASRGSETWRRLLVEAVWTSAPSSTPLAVELARRATAGTAQETAVAVVSALVAGDLGGTEPARDVARIDPATMDLASLDTPERYHAGLLLSRALLRAGRTTEAIRVAEDAAAAAATADAQGWAELARLEAAWARYLLDGDGAVVEGVGSGASAAPRLRALLHLLAVDRDPAAPASGAADGDRDAAVWHAIAAEALFALGETDEAAVQATLAGLPADDPAVALLAGPVSLATAHAWGVPLPDVTGIAPLAAESGAITSSGHPSPDVWKGVMVRGEVRCLLADGKRAEAAALARSAGLRRWADRSGAVAVDPDDTGRTDGLTARERQVLELVALGCTTPVIARRLGIAASTVESHIKNAKTKLGVSSRAGAVARAT